MPAETKTQRDRAPSLHLHPLVRLELLELLNKKQMAAKLEISASTLDTWIRERKIPYLKIAGIYRFSWPRVRQALDKFEVKEEQ